MPEPCPKMQLLETLSKALTTREWSVYLVHGVGPVLGLHLGVVDDVRAVLRELVAQEEVDEVDLQDGVGKVEHLAREVLEGVEGVRAAVQAHVLHDQVDLVSLGVVVDDRLVQAWGEAIRIGLMNA